jgi:hypothetical protein
MQDCLCASGLSLRKPVIASHALAESLPQPPPLPKAAAFVSSHFDFVLSKPSPSTRE